LFNSQAPRPSWRHQRATSDYGQDRFGIFDRMRRNPVPATLACAGLAWLAWSGNGEDGRTASNEVETYGGSYGQGTSGEMSASSSTSSRSTVAAVGERGQQVARDLTAAARQKTRRARNGLQRLMEDSPLIVGAAAAMIGAAVGAALPETEREREWMGEARESVMEGAQNLARGQRPTPPAKWSTG